MNVRETVPSEAPSDALEAYPAALYSAVHDGNPGDREFYRALCRGTEKVLEFGIGDGRIARDIVGEVDKYVGVDLHEGLLARGRAALPNVIFLHADMTSVELQERFDRVLLPYNGLYCLLSEESMLEALRNAFAHLKPGGKFAFDVYAADQFHEYAEQDELDEHTFVKSVVIEGTEWVVGEHSTWDRASQRIDAHYSHEASTERITAEIQQRYLLHVELEPLLTRAGFRNIRIAGGFAGEPAEDDARMWVVVAERPATS